MTTEAGDEPTFDWGAVVPRLIHPVKVAIIEALLWIGEPLSPTDMVKLFDDDRDHYLSLVSYHAAGLVKVGAIKPVRTRQVRGALEKFYFFPDA